VKNLLKQAAAEYLLAHECFIMDYSKQDEYVLALNLDRKEEPTQLTL
jgi:hypothetical protein